MLTGGALTHWPSTDVSLMYLQPVKLTCLPITRVAEICANSQLLSIYCKCLTELIHLAKVDWVSSFDSEQTRPDWNKCSYAQNTDTSDFVNISYSWHYANKVRFRKTSVTINIYRICISIGFYCTNALYRAESRRYTGHVPASVRQATILCLAGLTTVNIS